MDELDGGCLPGGCPQGVVNDLRTAVNAGDVKITNSMTDLPQLHEKLEDVQAWLVDDSTSNAGAVDTMTNFVTEINTML